MQFCELTSSGKSGFSHVEHSQLFLVIQKGVCSWMNYMQWQAVVFYVLCDFFQSVKNASADLCFDR